MEKPNSVPLAAIFRYRTLNLGATWASPGRWSNLVVVVVPRSTDCTHKACRAQALPRMANATQAPNTHRLYCGSKVWRCRGWLRPGICSKTSSGFSGLCAGLTKQRLILIFTQGKVREGDVRRKLLPSHPRVSAAVT